jgi:hypothetical protein
MEKYNPLLQPYFMYMKTCILAKVKLAKDYGFESTGFEERIPSFIKGVGSLFSELKQFIASLVLEEKIDIDFRYFYETDMVRLTISKISEPKDTDGKNSNEN